MAISLDWKKVRIGERERTVFRTQELENGYYRLWLGGTESAIVEGAKLEAAMSTTNSGTTEIPYLVFLPD